MMNFVVSDGALRRRRWRRISLRRRASSAATAAVQARAEPPGLVPGPLWTQLTRAQRYWIGRMSSAQAQLVLLCPACLSTLGTQAAEAWTCPLCRRGWSEPDEATRGVLRSSHVQEDQGT